MLTVRAGDRLVRGRLLLAFLLMLAGTSAWALDRALPAIQYVHDSWSTKDGLPEGPVLALMPAPDGYLWLGTRAGLVRFDGVRFRIFEPADLGVRQYSFARHLVRTNDGAIWGAIVGGVSRYGSGRFEVFGEAQGLSHPFVYALAPGPSGSLWVGTGGSGIWQLSNGVFSHHPAYRSAGLPAQVNDLAVDGRGVLWAATGDGVLALGPQVRRFGTADGLGSQAANVLLFGRDGALWVGTRGGLSRRVGERFRTYTTRDGLSSDDVTVLFEDGQGTLWIGTRTSGLNRLRGAQVERVGDRASGDAGVLALAAGEDGSLWIGTDRGLERYQRPSFRTLGREAGLGDERILNLVGRRAGGLWVLEGSGELRVLDDARDRAGAAVGVIPGQGMVPLAETPDGSVWVGGSALHRLRNGRWDQYRRPGGDFTVLMPDGGGLLVAQTEGDGRSTLARFDGRAFEAVPVEVPLVHVQRLFRDRAGRLWISTGGAGLVRVDAAGTRAFRARDGLPHEVVYDLEEDDSGSLWIATRAGLARIRGEVVVSFADQDELPRRAPMNLARDAQGRLWVTAEDGVHAIRTADLDALAERRIQRVPVRTFATSDGLRSVEFSWRCPGHVRTPDGRLWFATSRGVSVVDPRAVATDPKAPPTVIEEVLLAGHPAPLRDPVRVPASARERIAIRFTAPTTTAADQLRFRFRLADHEDWVDEQTTRVASYTNLPPGGYAFQVVARHGNGDWGATPAVLRLEVEPRWHETLPARLAALGAIGLGLVGMYRLRVRRMRLCQRVLLRMVEERTSELREEVGERRRAEEEVRRLNEQLEERVRERTAQLESANEALAADVSERRKAESALAQEKERLVVTLRSLAEGVITTDVEGRIVLMNPAAERHTGRRSEEVLGTRVGEVFRVADRFDRSRLPDPVARVLGSRGTAPERVTRALLLAGGRREILVDASAAPIREHEGAVVGAVLVFRDVTDKTRAEEQIQKAQKLEAIGVLAGGIAHDFNNLLTGIFGHVDLARASLETGSDAANRLARALEVLDDARSLTRQLLTFSAGGRPATEPHALGELLQRSARFVLSGSELTAELDVPEDLWPCDVDPLQIRQAINNLLLNARQAMPRGGHVTIRAANLTIEGPHPSGLPPGRYVELEIADEGEGISPEIRNRVFEPFFTTKPSGTGLGLATVHSIVTQHGGAIEFDSVPGYGTTFRLLLRAALAAPGPEQQTPEPIPPARGCGRVLVMDDEPVVSEIATAALEWRGYDVETAPNGDAAVAAFARAIAERRPFDVVILDLTIAGGMGGVETLARLREMMPDVKAIATSGYTGGGVLADPSAFGFCGTLAKPYAISDLAAAIASLIQGAASS